MDALSQLLAGPRARGAFLLRAALSPPWSIRVQDQAPLSMVTVVRGAAWVLPEHGDAVRLLPEDVAIMRGPDPYTFADEPSTPVRVVIHPGPRRSTPTGQQLRDVADLGPRTWGNGLESSTVMLISKYQMSDEISRRLLTALPSLLVLPHDARPSSPLAALLAEEIVRDEPGQEAILDRLVDLLLVATLRAWFARPETTTPAWYRALEDPVTGTALRLLHDNPAHPWTVALLAARTGVSRATLARRFTDLVGEPPMTYLTGWRLDLATNLLQEPDSTIDAVARHVGYGSASALSTAFKREHGLSPQQHRRKAG